MRTSFEQSDYNYSCPTAFLHPHHLPTTMKHHQQYTPSSKSADVNRLLDPSYSSASSSGSSDPYSQPTVYVDHRGDLHDPDFKYFPTLNTDSRRRRSTKRNSSDFYQSEDGEEHSGTEDRDRDEWQGRSMLTTSSRLTTRQRRAGGRSLSPSHYPTNYYSYPSSANTSPSYSSTPLSSSPDSCYQSSSSRKLSKSTPRSSLDYSPSSLFSTLSPESPFDEDDEDDDESHNATQPEVKAKEASPTRKEVLKKEWASVQLTMRIGAFRMKKRLGTAFA